MKEPNAHIGIGIPQGFHAGTQSIHLDRFDSTSTATSEPLLNKPVDFG